jgi:bifunctional DNase/RNase
MREFGVRSLASDSLQGGAPVLLLESADGDILPIWIGPAEAYAIATQLAGIQPPRPMTHDLMVTLISSLGGTLKRVVITGLRDGTYYALLHIEINDSLVVIDARPSDSVALALRVNCPILVEDDIPTFRFDDATEEAKDLKARLKEFRAEDFRGEV